MQSGVCKHAERLFSKQKAQHSARPVAAALPLHLSVPMCISLSSCTGTAMWVFRVQLAFRQLEFMQCNMRKSHLSAAIYESQFGDQLHQLMGNEIRVILDNACNKGMMTSVHLGIERADLR